MIGVHVLLEAVRAESEARPRRRGRPPPRFLQVSTDEVYGSVERAARPRPMPLAPRSPYAAAKAAGELLVRSYVVTYGLDAVVTRGSNTYGPYQHPEKLIPLFVTNALDDQPLPLYGDGLQRARLAVRRRTTPGAIEHVLRHGATGETYNVPGAAELTNREVVDRAARARSASRGRSSGRVADRPGPRPPLRDGRLEAARPSAGGTGRPFDDGLAATVDWFRERAVVAGGDRVGDWDAYYERQYGARLAASDRAPEPMRVAVTGAGGRLGRALVAALEEAPFTGPAGPTRLDAARLRPRRARRRSPRCSTATGPRSSSMPRPGPTSTAAPATRSWRCAATATATGVAGRGCRRARGRPDRRLDERGLRRPADRRRAATRPTTRPNPINPYGASKLAGEAGARADGVRGGAGRRGRRSAIVRTAWLFGPPGTDFPAKIVAAADRAARRRRAAPARGRRGRLADVRRTTSPRRSSS